ncbi:hypothetical protein LCGC14_1356780 [marine sediment metagenome]|uniref:Leucine-rich repeat domain-containing protein n=1 Tax=marine sediment metagenome TaxID=412755 RepID=A0A0F9NBH5_9ZZZZ|nr:leucine-rich repeat domain-containing protein [archaeon]
MREFKVNKLISLRLIDGETILFVNNREFKQCKILLLNIPTEDGLMDEIEEAKSIDEIEEYFDVSMDFEYVDVSPEEEFMGHCSNLQVWAENYYDTDLLHKSLAFPLLKALSEVGDTFAKQRFGEEIARRYKYGNKTVRRFLFEEGYLLCLSNEDILSGILSPEEAIFMEKIMEFGERYSIVPYFRKLREIDTKGKAFMSLEDGKIDELEIIINEDLNRIPREIENLSSLDSLYLSIKGSYYGNLFGEEFSVPSVKNLTIFCNSTVTIPDSFYYFPNLKYLRIRGPDSFNKPAISFENSFKKLPNLQELHLYSIKLKKLPDSIINLKNLRRLRLSKTSLKTLPISLICTLSSLRSLELKYNSDLKIQKIEIEKLERKIKQFKYQVGF